MFDIATNPVLLCSPPLTHHQMRSTSHLYHHCYRSYTLSNVILADKKITLFHQYLRYSHKHGTIAFSKRGAIIWAYSHIASMVFARSSLFEHVIYSWGALHCLLLCPCIGSHSTTLSSGSSGCLIFSQWIKISPHCINNCDVYHTSFYEHNLTLPAWFLPMIAYFNFFCHLFLCGLHCQQNTPSQE